MKGDPDVLSSPEFTHGISAHAHALHREPSSSNEARRPLDARCEAARNEQRRHAYMLQGPQARMMQLASGNQHKGMAGTHVTAASAAMRWQVWRVLGVKGLGEAVCAHRRACGLRVSACLRRGSPFHAALINIVMVVIGMRNRAGKSDARARNHRHRGRRHAERHC